MAFGAVSFSPVLLNPNSSSTTNSNVAGSNVVRIKVVEQNFCEKQSKITTSPKSLYLSQAQKYLDQLKAS